MPEEKQQTEGKQIEDKQQIAVIYGIKIIFKGNDEEIFEIVNHIYSVKDSMLQITTSKGLHNIIPLENIKRIEFDLRFTQKQLNKIQSENKKGLKEAKT